MIGIDVVYVLAGALFAIIAIGDALDRSNPRRWRNALFWGAYAVLILFGPIIGDVAAGGLVLVLAVVAGVGGLGRGEPRTSSAEERAAGAARHKNWLFVPALLVPALILVATLVFKDWKVGERPLFDPKNLSVIALGLAAVVALAAALALLRQPLAAPAREARRLMDLIGWAAVLPQMLASLGVVFAAAGVGDRIAEILGYVVPLDVTFAVVSAYCLGMALFTMVMGNAFAAFPVMTAAVGLPIIVDRLGADPAVMGAIGMLSGFCGTLMTPMAANFNIVPAALLELPDKNAVIKAQVPTALVVLAGNTVLMYLLVRHAR